MNRIEIVVMKPQAALAAFAETWRRLEAGDENFLPRLAFGTLHELFSVITEKRLELLRYVVDHEGLDIRQLAQAMSRDCQNVHTDVAELTALGLLDKDEQGLVNAPFDEIVIHAALREVA
jgi:predicted transcriptional regulator